MKKSGAGKLNQEFSTANIARWRAARRILCVRLDALGDVLMTTPAIRALKESCAKDCRITLLASPSGARVARLVPEIDEIITYEPAWMKATPPRADASFDAAMIAKLERARFDASVIFTVYSQNPLPAALVCFLADIPLRLAHCRENPYQLLTDWAREIEPHEIIRHEVRRQLDLVAHVGCRTTNERISLSVSNEARRRARERLAQLGINGEDLWIVLHPGATAASRRYAPQKFARVAEKLRRELGAQIIFTGSRDERELVSKIQAMTDAATHSLAGELDLEDFAALVSLAPLLVSNNSGPVHIAAAVGAPVVDIYALTNPQHTPWGVPHRVLSYNVPCKFCYKSVCPAGHHDCLNLISPDEVASAARELLLETAPRLVSRREKSFDAEAIALSGV